jgi:predicted outer membrane protein
VEPVGDTTAASARTQLDRLNSETRGVAWDQAYMEYEITHLRAFLETLNRATAATSSQPLKLQLMKSTPVLQSHLDQAIVLQAKLPH